MNKWVLQGPVGTEVTIQGKRYLLFSGTDYLGMAGRPELARGAEKAAALYGISSSSSRTSVGTTELHLELEKQVSRFAGTEDTVVMATGYMSMGALLTAVLEKNDEIVIQHNAHPSIREAVTVRSPDCSEFKIEGLETLKEALKKPGARAGRIIVVAEGVAPLFGTVFPLPEVLKVLEDRDSLVLLDDAHGLHSNGRVRWRHGVPGGGSLASPLRRERGPVDDAAHPAGPTLRRTPGATPGQAGGSARRAHHRLLRPVRRRLPLSLRGRVAGVLACTAWPCDVPDQLDCLFDHNTCRFCSFYPFYLEDLPDTAALSLTRCFSSIHIYHCVVMFSPL